VLNDYYPFKGAECVVLYVEKSCASNPTLPGAGWSDICAGCAQQQALSSGQEIDAIYATLAKHTDVKDRSLYPKMQPVDWHGWAA